MNDIIIAYHSGLDCLLIWRPRRLLLLWAVPVNNQNDSGTYIMNKISVFLNYMYMCTKVYQQIVPLF